MDKPPSSSSKSSLFLIGKNSRGNWVVRDQKGLRFLLSAHASNEEFFLFRRLTEELAAMARERGALVLSGVQFVVVAFA